MTNTLFTIQEHNVYNGYDGLYPKTHASLIVNPPQATGARIDVLCLPASSGIVVNLSGQKTASATTDSNGKCSFEGLDYGEYTISATISGSEKNEALVYSTVAPVKGNYGPSFSVAATPSMVESISAISSVGNRPSEVGVSSLVGMPVPFSMRFAKEPTLVLPLISSVVLPLMSGNVKPVT